MGGGLLEGSENGCGWEGGATVKLAKNGCGMGYD